jgi:hypothetical protein
MVKKTEKYKDVEVVEMTDKSYEHRAKPLKKSFNSDYSNEDVQEV